MWQQLCRKTFVAGNSRFDRDFKPDLGYFEMSQIQAVHVKFAQVKLRITLDDTVFVTTRDLVVWDFRELNVIPAGGEAAVWNGVFDPTQAGKATVRLTLKNAGRVKIQVFTTDATLVKTVADEDAGVGVRTWSWTGRSERGETLASGLYLIRIRAPGINETKKAILVK